MPREAGSVDEPSFQCQMAMQGLILIDVNKDTVPLPSQSVVPSVRINGLIYANDSSSPLESERCFCCSATEE